MKFRIFLALAVLAIASIACGVTAVPASVAIQPTAITIPAVATQTPVNVPNSCYGIVTAGKLNLRADPDPEANPDGAGLVDGDIVRIIGTVGTWYKVETTDGRQGYAKADFISRPGCAK